MSAPPSPAPEAPPPRRRLAILETLAIFAIAWLMMGIYAFRDEPLQIAGLEVKQTDIAALWRGEDTTSPAVPRGLAVGAPAPPPPAPVAAPEVEPAVAPAPARPVDEAPQRILLFGDSMIDELMLRLADYCAHNGHELHPAIWYGAGVINWSQDDKLDRLLREVKPTFVIAVLGSNDLTSRNLRPRRVAVNRVLDKLKDQPLIWVGPPNWTEDTGINQLLSDAVGPGRYFRSETLFQQRNLPRAPDGIHPTHSASGIWMDEVASWIMAKSDHPITLREPTEKAKRPVARIFAPPGRSGGT